MAYTVIIGDKFSGPMARKSAPTRGAAMAHAKSELRDYMSTGDKHERQGQPRGRDRRRLWGPCGRGKARDRARERGLPQGGGEVMERFEIEVLAVKGVLEDEELGELLEGYDTRVVRITRKEVE